MVPVLVALLTFVVTAAVAPPVSAQAPAPAAPRDERRTALVIGNGAYQNGPLRNPVRDAKGMARVLRGQGFEVTLLENAGQKETRRAINDFGKKLREGSVGLFYYAGHGLQVNGRNYLVPVDAAIEEESEVEIEAVDVGAVLSRMDVARNRLNIVILDACRDNPYARSFRSQVRGLASIDAPSGTMIAYATAPGRVARDGAGANGLYTGELLRAMTVPGLRIEDVFKQVRQSVQQQTRGEQVPWESSSLVGDFVFSMPAPAATTRETATDGGAARSTARAPVTLAGAWRGDMIQPDSHKGSYPMILTITELGDGGYRGAVDYPSLGCSGWLTIVERTGVLYRFRERIERGGEACVNGGLVEMRLTGHGSIQIDWYFPEGSLGATSVLRRTD
jgi:caspase domain-containing protein